MITCYISVLGNTVKDNCCVTEWVFWPFERCKRGLGPSISSVVLTSLNSLFVDLWWRPGFWLEAGVAAGLVVVVLQSDDSTQDVVRESTETVF